MKIEFSNKTVNLKCISELVRSRLSLEIININEIQNSILFNLFHWYWSWRPLHQGPQIWFLELLQFYFLQRLWIFVKVWQVFVIIFHNQFTIDNLSMISNVSLFSSVVQTTCTQGTIFVTSLNGLCWQCYCSFTNNGVCVVQIFQINTACVGTSAIG